MPTPIIFDTDPGHDDAIALLLAARAPEIRLLAVTAVAGNQTLEKTTLNARRVMTIGQVRDVPLAAGMAGPLLRPLKAAGHVHGESGLDGYDFGRPEIALVAEHAVDLMIRTVREAPAPVTLVPVGPLTNVAMALLRAPEIVEGVERIVLMGGAAHLGNVTPAAEFNIHCDPEAAAIIFGAGIPITMVGLDATLQARIRPAERERIRALGTPVGSMVASLLAWYAESARRRDGRDDPPVHDALAVAAVIRPGIVETRRVNVVVETTGEYTAGRTVCDLNGVTDRPPNADVAVGVDREAFAELLVEGLGRYGRARS
ncbi:MAG: nucleoside hydrolase [Actinobacteria bacterium]|nr:nucleoside hydrolase [Actinomycetota bacterium]